MRPSARALDQLRAVEIVLNPTKYAEGSCLIKMGDTHVLCTATVEDKAPAFLKGSGLGWVTAEYGMLPRATQERTSREAAKGRQTGRTQEIQRLIGRALRAVVNRKAMGEMQVKLDCDVLQADGGTRTASITGSYVAMALAFRYLVKIGRFRQIPLLDSVAAISCGISNGAVVLDLDYAEDSEAGADSNFVLTGKGGIVEVQGTAEQTAFSEEQFLDMLRLARLGCGQLAEIQKKALGL